MIRNRITAMVRLATPWLASTALVLTLAAGQTRAEEPSGTLTVAWPEIYSFVGVPSSATSVLSTVRW